MALFKQLKEWILSKLPKSKSRAKPAASIELRSFYPQDPPDDEVDTPSFDAVVRKLRRQALQGSMVARNYLLQLADLTQDRRVEYTAAEVLANQKNSRELSNIALMYYLRAAQNPLSHSPAQFKASIKAKLYLSLLYASASLRSFIQRVAQPILGSDITIPSLDIPPHDDVASRYVFDAIKQSPSLTHNLQTMPLDPYQFNDKGYFQLGEFFETQATSQTLPDKAEDFFRRAVAYYQQVSPNFYLFEMARHKAAHILYYTLESPTQALEVLAPLIKKGDRDAIQLQYIIQRSEPKSSSNPLGLDDEEDDFLTPADLPGRFKETGTTASAQDERLKYLHRYQARFEEQGCILINQPNNRSITMPQRMYLKIAGPLTQEAFQARFAEIATESPFRVQLRRIVTEAERNLQNKNQDSIMVKRRLREVRTLLRLLDTTIEVPSALVEVVALPGQGEAEAKQKREAEERGLRATRVVYDDDTELYRQCVLILEAHEELSYWQRFQGKANFKGPLEALIDAVQRLQVIAYLYQQDLLKALPKLMSAKITTQEKQLESFQQEIVAIKSGTRLEQVEAQLKERDTQLEQRDARIRQLEATNLQQELRIKELETRLGDQEKAFKEFQDKSERDRAAMERAFKELHEQMVKDREQAQRDREQAQRDREQDRNRIQRLEIQLNLERGARTIREQLAKSGAKEADLSEGILVTLLCPIGLELVRKPVMTVDGHTFEQSNIEKWFKQERDAIKQERDEGRAPRAPRNPITNEPLKSLELRPVFALQGQVDECRRLMELAAKKIKAASVVPTASPVPPSPVAQMILGLAVQYLQHHHRYLLRHYQDLMR